MYPLQPHLRQDAIRRDQEPDEEVPGHPRSKSQNTVPKQPQPRSPGKD